MNNAFYISGHGLGHASRQVLIINEILRQKPDTGIFIRSMAPEWFFHDEIGSPIPVEPVACGTGAVQVDSLILDKKATLEQFRDFYINRKAWYDKELAFIKDAGIHRIVTDLSPFAMELAHQADIPCIGVGNFTWDWIYEPYAGEFPAFKWIPHYIRTLHRYCDLMIRLPFSHEFRDFKKVKDVPLFGHVSGKSADQIRKALDIPPEKKTILLSFGGFSIKDFNCEWMAQQQDYHFMACETSYLDVPGLHNLDRDRLKQLKLEYCDLVKAVDCVFTKPGYGILADCMANGTGIIYTSRGEFREYDVLVENIQKYLPNKFIDPQKLRRGEIQDVLRDYFQDFKPVKSVAKDGVGVAVGLILNLS